MKSESPTSYSASRLNEAWVFFESRAERGSQKIPST
jgi:hypothetical protein